MMFNWDALWLIAHAVPISKGHPRFQIKGQHTGARLAGQWQDVHDRFEVIDSY